MNLSDTLYNPVWVADNQGSILSMLPENWTPVDEHAALKTGFALKLIGIDWRTSDDLGFVMATLQQLGFLQQLNEPPVYRRDPSARNTIILTA